MKKKLFFEEPELEVVRFDPKDIYTTTSCPFDINADGCEGEDVCMDDDCPDNDF